MKKFIILFLSIVLFSMNNTFANVKEEAKFSKRQAISYIEDEPGVYVVKIHTPKLKEEVKPYVSVDLVTTKQVFDEQKYTLVVNGGFFDLKNKKTVSFVVIDGETVADPNDNENLIGNKYLEQYLDKILDRSELRIYNFQGHDVFDITPHSESVPVNCTLKHSI